MNEIDDSETAVAEAHAAFLAFREADIELWRRAGNDLGLTTLGMLVLARVLRAAAAESPLRQIDLARSLHLSPAGVSQIIDTLEGRGLVRRSPSTRDRRAVDLLLGPDAEAIARDVLAGDAEFARLAAEHSPAQLRSFASIMRGMAAVSSDKFTTDPQDEADRLA